MKVLIEKLAIHTRYLEGWENHITLLNLTKKETMNTSELKLQIFRQLDLLDKSQLSELSGIVTNLVHGQYGIADWESLSIMEKEGIIESIKQLDRGEGIQHESVMGKARKRFTNV